MTFRRPPNSRSLPQTHMHGHSIIRPLLNVFPTDIAARDVDDQFMWGEGFMVAPVITQGAVSRVVYFPQVNEIPVGLAST